MLVYIPILCERFTSGFLLNWANAAFLFSEGSGDGVCPVHELRERRIRMR
jgi:hypothetical protein